MYDAVLIHDKESKYKSGIARAFNKADNIKVLDWNDEDVQTFLDKQFGWRPKSMMVIDEDKVYVGENATEHLVERIGVPKTVTKLAKSRAPPVSAVVSTLTGDDSDDITGEFPLDEDAEDIVDEFINGTDIPIN
jgi:hypothetical protein